jgi:hypothetical protein
MLTYVFKDSDLKVKQTFQATSNLNVLTVTEAGQLLGMSKDQMKAFVNQNGLTKVRIMRSTQRYLLLKDEIDNLVK